MKTGSISEKSILQAQRNAEICIMRNTTKIFVLSVAVALIVAGCAATSTIGTTGATTRPTLQQNVAAVAGQVQSAAAVASPVVAFIPGWGQLAAAILAGIGLGAGAVKAYASATTPLTPTQAAIDAAHVVSTVAASLPGSHAAQVATIATEAASVLSAANNKS